MHKTWQSVVYTSTKLNRHVEICGRLVCFTQLYRLKKLALPAKMLHLFYHIVKVLLLLLLPFMLLIRGAVYFHEAYRWFPWPSILGGILATTVLVIIYIGFLYGRLSGRPASWRSLKIRLWVALIVVLGYSLYGIFYLSNEHLKDRELRKEYNSLHPILRLSISTLLFADHSLLITDTRRAPEDYRKMGLKSKKHSLHYPQRNGYVHAVDIRTRGRSELRNKLIRIYFGLMGLRTLRHGGTADHLHVSLMSHDRPGGM